MSARLHRGCLGAVVVLLALAAATLLLCLTPVDNTPYFHTPYFSNTVARLQTADAAAPRAASPLSAGFGRASLTPTAGTNTATPDAPLAATLPLAGYGSRRGQPAAGVHDHLWCRSVALKTDHDAVVFVTADALIIPREIAETTRRLLANLPGLRPDQIYFGATHTHAGPGGWGRGWVQEAFAGPFQPGVPDWFASCLARAVREAWGDLTPAMLAVDTLHAPEFVRNRLVGSLGTVDDEFSWIAIRQADGDLGIVGAYAAHATVLSSRIMEFSGDYPGAWSRALEEATGGLAAFFAGGVGSHSPQPRGSGFAAAQDMGATLAARILERLPHLRFTPSLVLEGRQLEVDLPAPHVRLTDSLRLRPFLARRLVPVPRSTTLTAVRIGDCYWFGVPADYSGESALRLKDHLRARGALAVPTSFAGDYLGYLIPSRYYHLDGYEPRLMSFFGPTAADYFEDLLIRLGRHLGVPRSQDHPDPPAARERAGPPGADTARALQGQNSPAAGGGRSRHPRSARIRVDAGAWLAP